MNKLNQKGFAGLLVVILILTIVFTIITGIVLLIFNEHKISRNIINSNKAYYLAESGIEDVLLRIKNNPLLSNFSYSFEAGDGEIEVNVSENIGGSLIIISKGETAGLIRKIKVVYQIDFERASFFYGAQAGEGGLVMRNNSVIKGNVFSNGSVLGANKAEVTDSVIVAGEKIDNIKVGKDAKVYNCYNSQINGDLFYVDQINDCSASGQIFQSGEISQADFPISAETIEKWKSQGEAAEKIVGNYNVSGSVSLGPVHIQGDLILDVGSNLKMKGIILVDGNLRVENNAVLELDPNEYQTLSGVIIIQGKVQARPGSILRGSGQPGSYLMIISLNDSLDNAIQIDNTSDAGIFFAPYGAILMNQNVKVREAMAYKIILQENAVIEYEVGLSNLFFSSGAGGGWKVLTWQEI